jgi:branched-chain amino acid transport system substrate-binding protein
MAREFISRTEMTRRKALGLLVGATSIAALRPAVVSAQTDKIFRIGMIRPLTGRFASSFAPLYAPARVAAEEINASGGLLGKMIEFVEEDDEGSPAKEPAVMRKLQEAGVNVVVGPVGTSQAVAALSVSTPGKIIQADGAYAVEVVDGKQYPYHYQFNYNTRHQSAAVADLFAKQLGFKKIGLIHEVTGWGESFAARVVEDLKVQGVTPVAVESYALSVPDLRSQVRNLQRAGAEAVIVGSSIVPGSIIVLNAFKNLAWFPPIAGGNGFFGDAVLDILPADATNNVYATFLRSFTYSAKEPAGERQINYVKKLLAYPEVKGQEPNAAVSPFYDFLYALKTVIENTKAFDSESLKKGLDGIKNMAGMSGTLSLSPDDHCALPVDAVTMVKIASARDPRAMGCFRERATA